MKLSFLIADEEKKLRQGEAEWYVLFFRDCGLDAYYEILRKTERNAKLAALHGPAGNS